MKLYGLIAAVCTSCAIGQAAIADGLLGKITASVGTIVEKTGETITSTADMVTEDGSPDEVRAKIDTMASAALSEAFVENKDIETLFGQSAGYAVFDARNIIMGVSAGYGRGVAVSNATQQRTYMKMASGGVGWSVGLGGFATKVIMLFETEPDYSEFVTHGFDGTTSAGAMVGDETIDESLRFVDGKTVFVLTGKGLKLSASAVGTKYWADPELN
jgi:hypothetical protein